MIALSAGCAPEYTLTDTGDPPDLDGDGALDADDCEDNDEAVYPGAPELADHQDNDCDGEVDEGTELGDDDGDGFSEAAGDCDDENPDVHPDAEEIPYDGIDQDCDYQDIRDVDGDGYDAPDVGGVDCDDGDPLVHPEAPEIPYDGGDQDCDGEDLLDVDGDGFDAVEAGGSKGDLLDCDDEDPDVYPSAPEEPDYVDNDCDGVVDEGTVNADDDGDGWSEAEGDCNDSRDDAYPGHPEIEGDGVDNDCNGMTDEVAFDGPVVTGASTYNYFGRDLDLGDVDCDGRTDLVVASYADDGGGSNAGQVWVVPAEDATSGVVSGQATVSYTGARSSAYFGWAVDVVSDMDGDGCDELLVSAPYDYEGTPYSEGITYLIPGVPDGAYGLGEAASDRWASRFDGGSNYVYAGDDVSSGDLDGDGFVDIAVGVDNHSSSAGRVYLMYGDAGGPGAWGQRNLAVAADLEFVGEGSYDYFGGLLKIVPDTDGDGREDLLVRAAGEDTVYLFTAPSLGTSTVSARNAAATFTNTSASSWGQGMAAGDLDGDGDAEVVLTEPNGEGNVFIYDNRGAGFSGTLSTSAAAARIHGDYDYFGYSAAIGDVDDDGGAELLVGAYGYSEVEVNAGAVFIFEGEDYRSLSGGMHNNTGTPVISDTYYDQVGWQVATGRSWWAAGTYGYSTVGAAYLMTIP